MRALLLCCAVLGLLSACGSHDKQWYKPNAEYTVAEFRRDRAACEKAGQVDEDCLRQRGWVSLSPDKDRSPIPTTPTSRGRYY